MKYPRLFLSADNCFASKRWTEPEQWLKVISDLGLSYTEASTDNECDPLYTTPEYIQDWQKKVLVSCERLGMTIANMFSGHGTYNTLGLAHTDHRIRAHLYDNWIKPFLRTAKALGSGAGFFCHAFSQAVLQSPTDYESEVEALLESLLEISRFNRSISGGPLCAEQMYAPHLYPWTIDGAYRMIAESETYLALDTGHQTGQHKFLRPSPERLERACRIGGGALWVGTCDAQAILIGAQEGRIAPGDAMSAIQESIAENNQLFSTHDDCDLYTWIERLGCYSPIIHLQQTDGVSSNHKAFSFKPHPDDKVFPEKVLSALARSYENPDVDGIEKCSSIYLTLELFFPTSDYPGEILSKMRESVGYWRSFIPRDGMKLDEALALLDARVVV